MKVLIMMTMTSMMTRVKNHRWLSCIIVCLQSQITYGANNGVQTSQKGKARTFTCRIPAKIHIEGNLKYLMHPGRSNCYSTFPLDLNGYLRCCTQHQFQYYHTRSLSEGRTHFCFKLHYHKSEVRFKYTRNGP